METSNVIALASVQADYQDHVSDVIDGLKKRHRKHEQIDPYQVINQFVSVTENNHDLAEWFNDNGIMTIAEFKKAIARKKKIDGITKVLGFYPMNALDYVQKYTKENNITALLTGELAHEKKLTFDGKPITTDDRQDRQIDTYARLVSNTSFNTEELKLDLRVKAHELDLHFSDNQIADAVSKWMKEAKQTRRTHMFMNVAYTAGRASGPDGIAMWEKMERAAFDISSTATGFPTAILKKFMWQVKRKAYGLPVTDHLMPVITGKQGGGKSTLVTNMMQPIVDSMKVTNFGDVANDKLIDLWESAVLFMDEMSGARKADMNTVKQAITASTLTRRPMRSNDTVTVKQMATFIGCSNDSLGEIIKDPTGVRRFAELEFTDTPDWTAMNEIDWLMLWRSVDEHSADPSANCFDLLKAQQEANRFQDSVETWAAHFGGKFKSPASSTELHTLFTAENGKLCIQVRYGAKVLELAKGKTAIEVGSTDNLIPTLDALKDAVASGELDGQIEAVSETMRSGFAAK
jgi:hypothetical protein